MARQLTAGPLHLVINQGHTVLVIERDGQMTQGVHWRKPEAPRFVVR